MCKIVKFSNIHCHSLDFIQSINHSSCETYAFQILDHIKCNNVVLNICKDNLMYSINATHFNFYHK